jgi:hypothetical protein
MRVVLIFASVFLAGWACVESASVRNDSTVSDVAVDDSTAAEVAVKDFIKLLDDQWVLLVERPFQNLEKCKNCVARAAYSQNVTLLPTGQNEEPIYRELLGKGWKLSPRC